MARRSILTDAIDYSEFLPFYFFALSTVMGLWLAAHSIGVILRLARFG